MRKRQSKKNSKNSFSILVHRTVRSQIVNKKKIWKEFTAFTDSEMTQVLSSGELGQITGCRLITIDSVSIVSIKTSKDTAIREWRDNARRPAV